MAKKKKTQLKPVARGFATTSVPKKIAAEGDPELPENDVGGSNEDALQSEAGPSTSNAVPVQVSVDEFDPDQVEEQSLQNLVDRLQSSTEKDVVRAVKVRR